MLCLKYCSAVPLLKCHLCLSVCLLLKHSKIAIVFLVKSFHPLYRFRFLTMLSYKLILLASIHLLHSLEPQISKYPFGKQVKYKKNYNSLTVESTRGLFV